MSIADKLKQLNQKYDNKFVDNDELDAVADQKLDTSLSNLDSEEVDAENRHKVMKWITTSDVFSSIGPRFIRASFVNETYRQYTNAQMLRMGLVGTDIWNFKGIQFLPFWVTLSDNSIYYQDQLITKTFTGLTAGKHYYIWVVKQSDTYDIVVSQSKTSPGVTTNAQALIGGFETECVSITSSNTPNTVVQGISAGQIIPNSIWCTSFRPTAYDPSGMAYIDESTCWGDIYLQSGTKENTASTYGATITDTRLPQNHFNDMIAVGKFIPNDCQFTQMAYGTQNGYAIQGAADPVTTGGHLNTNGKRITSCYFLEDCCGVLWQWLSDIGPTGGSSWTARTLDDSYASVGSSYGNPYVLLAGGPWSDSSNCGVCSRAAAFGFATTSDYSSCRGLSHTKLW